MGAPSVDTSAQDEEAQKQTEISQQNLELNKQALDAQNLAAQQRNQELEILQQQIGAQTDAYQSQLGLLSQQVDSSNKAAQAQQDMYAQQSDYVAQQKLLSDAETARSQYVKNQSQTDAALQLASATSNQAQRQKAAMGTTTKATMGFARRKTMTNSSASFSPSARLSLLK